MLAEQAVTETYEDVEKTIFDLCWKFSKSQGGDFDDYRSVANEAFMLAYHSYDGYRRVKFNTYVYQCVRNALCDEYTKNKQHRERFLCSEKIDNNPATKSHFDLEYFLSELPEDAKTVVGIIMGTPSELLSIMLNDDYRFRQGLRGVLSNMGWTTNRITESFIEIREALV